MRPFLNTAGQARNRAFTLVEVMVAATIFAIMIALVMGMVISQTRLGISVGNYADMNEYSRKAVTWFEKDMRLTRSVTNMSSGEIVANVIDPNLDLDGAIARYPKTAEVYYKYDTDTKQLYRESPKGSNRTIILENLLACQFMYFNKNDVPITDMTRTPDVKKVLISATMRRRNAKTNNTDYLVSAVVTMRSRP